MSVLGGFGMRKRGVGRFEGSVIDGYLVVSGWI